MATASAGRRAVIGWVCLRTAELHPVKRDLGVGIGVYETEHVSVEEAAEVEAAEAQRRRTQAHVLGDVPGLEEEEVAVAPVLVLPQRSLDD